MNLQQEEETIEDEERRKKKQNHKSLDKSKQRVWHYMLKWFQRFRTGTKKNVMFLSNVDS